MCANRPKGVASRDRLQQLIRAPRLPIDLASLDWTEFAPGVRFHTLARRADGVSSRALVWLQPAADVPLHDHETAEDVLLMQGALELRGDGAGVYEAGQIIHSPAGSIHSARVLSEEACLCHVVYWPAEAGKAIVAGS